MGGVMVVTLEVGVVTLEVVKLELGVVVAKKGKMGL